MNDKDYGLILPLPITNPKCMAPLKMNENKKKITRPIPTMIPQNQGLCSQSTGISIFDM